MKVVSSKVIIVLEADEVVVRESKGLLYLVIKSSLHPMALEYLGPFSVGVIWKPFCSLLPYKGSLLCVTIPANILRCFNEDFIQRAQRAFPFH